jgi:excisionase family DNA binding protein
MQHEGTQLYRVKAVADMFDVSVHTIYRAIKSGALDAYKIGSSLRIPAQAIQVFREDCAEAAYTAFVLGDESPAATDQAEDQAATVTPITARTSNGTEANV